MAGTLRSATRSTQRSHLTSSAWLALASMAGAVALIAYYAPEDADQGLSQKIFYCPYMMLRFSVSAGAQRENLCAVEAQTR